MRLDAPVTFSFGKNWQSYLRAADDAAFEQSLADIRDWLGNDGVAGRNVLDLGCGSGIHSHGFFRLGAARLVSFDYDPRSVAATRSLWDKAGRASHWTVGSGSILDAGFVRSLGSFELVYSWGVLHHTGEMWKAIDHATQLVAPAGRLWISIYTKGPAYARDLALKQRYNRASALGKRALEWRWILGLMYGRARARQNPLAWNQRTTRGMNTYHDLVDWLGGLPYEVASPEEILAFCAERGLAPERVEPVVEGGCSIYLMRRM
jgi:2-polyprenyl-6-hydroxyphenyl methylase/3-demethylubiquinone-9 3-methyltransferase